MTFTHCLECVKKKKKDAIKHFQINIMLRINVSQTSLFGHEN